MYKMKKREITVEDFLKLKKYSPFKTMRFNGKTVNLATLFAASGPTLGRAMKNGGFDEDDCDMAIDTFNLNNALTTAINNNNKGLSVSDLKYMIVGNKLREIFFQTYPGLLRRVEREQKFAMKHGYVRTWTGPIRHFPELRYMSFNAKGNLQGADQMIYSKMFAGLKNEASNTTIQTAEVYQAMPDVTAINKLLKKWQFKSRIFNYVHDSIVLYIYKPEKDIVYALLNQLSLEHREPYYGLRMYIDVVESDLDNPKHYYDTGVEIKLENYDIKNELAKWNTVHNTNLEYEDLIPK